MVVAQNDLVQPIEPPLIHHSLKVLLDPSNQQITVEDTITLADASPATAITFSLNSNLAISNHSGDLQILPADAPSADADATAAAMNRYSLTLPRRNAGQVLLIYSGMIFDIAEQSSAEYAQSFSDSSGIISEQGVYLNKGSGWIPDFGNDLLSFDLQVEFVESASNWLAVSQGDRAGKNAWTSLQPMEEIYLIAANFTEYSQQAGDVEVLAYLRQPDSKLAGKYMDATERYLALYEPLLGDYPYSKFALVENFWETGYGMPSFTLLGEQVIRFPFILHSSYPHEILHNWWGNSVFVDYESGNWCEGLTAYMADHLIQEQRGLAVNYRRSTLQKYRNYVRDGLDFPLSEFRSRHSAATEAVGYGKALMMFHMLRRKVGDDAFRSAFASFYRKNRGKRASFSDIQAAFDSVTDSDHSKFFDQWVNRIGAPSLVLNGITVKEQNGGFVIHGSIDQVQEIDPFMLDVPLHVQTQSGIETVVVSTTQRKQSFDISVNSQPLSIATDPMFDLFR
ncbi:MAG: peptidase M28, partial [Proteobacteria bacterium]|nr:peptidase M28 [Pseudomonadota bacterium]